MTKTELKTFRVTLLNLRTELESRNRSREILAIETSADELDRIQDRQERELAIGTLDRNSTSIRQVSNALQRIEAGTFGVCVDCGEDINARRLAAIPWAASCFACQDVADREQKLPWGELEPSLAVAD